MNRHCIPGLTMSRKPRRESWSVRIIKTMHTGFSAYNALHYANAPVLTRKETGRYDLAERFV